MEHSIKMFGFFVLYLIKINKFEKIEELEKYINNIGSYLYDKYKTEVESNFIGYFNNNSQTINHINDFFKNNYLFNYDKLFCDEKDNGLIYIMYNILNSISC